MNKILYFSGSGKSKRLAEYLAKELDFPISDIVFEMENSDYELALIVFPVYCQNLPDPVKNFLPKLKAKKVAFAATYGKKSFGNVIEDAVNITKSEFIGGVCIPCGHSFLSEADDFDFASLYPFIERIKNPEKAEVQSAKKDFYADLIPAQRTRIGIKIKQTDSCTKCGKCTDICPMGSIKYGKIGRNCIRCLRCINECPENALKFKTLWFMKAYLLPMRKNELKFYL